MSASQEQTLSGRGVGVYTAHRGWLGVVTGISAASTAGVLVFLEFPNRPTDRLPFYGLSSRQRG